MFCCIALSCLFLILSHTSRWPWILLQWTLLLEAFGKRNPICKARNACLDISPESRACPRARAPPNVEAHHHVTGPDPRRNSGGRRIRNYLSFEARSNYALMKTLWVWAPNPEHLSEKNDRAKFMYDIGLFPVKLCWICLVMKIRKKTEFGSAAV